MMTYTEAVAMAKNKEEAGFDFLYRSTYKEKYYLALKFTKNETDAEDVLQEAYLKAFEKLDTLADAEKFPAWLGMIVANTAKNALQKKKPALFSDLSVPNDEGEAFELQLEDDDLSVQPELAFSQKETKELVDKMISSLSDEQQMCIMMFYLEGLSVKEISESLECPENTVKSRLSYGRKHLKVKAEELQRKGYKLYGTAPAALLLLLFRLEREAVSAGITEIPTLPAGESTQVPTGASAEPPAGTAAEAPASGAGTAGKAAGAAAKAAKRGFFATAAGKITAVLLSCAIGAGAVAGGITYAQKQAAGSGTRVSAEAEAGAKAEAETEAQTKTKSKADIETVLTAYRQYIDENSMAENYKFVLLYIDNDKTPELYAFDSSNFQEYRYYSVLSCSSKIITYYNGQVVAYDLCYGEYACVEKSGLIYSYLYYSPEEAQDLDYAAVQEYISYKLSDGELVTVHSGRADAYEDESGSRVEYNYSWDGGEVTTDEFENLVEKNFDTSSAWDLERVVFDSLDEAYQNIDNFARCELTDALAYYKYYISAYLNSEESCKYSFVYIDDNDIPELYCESTTSSDATLYSYYKNEAGYLFSTKDDTYYNERSGGVLITYGSNSYTLEINTLENGRFTQQKSGTGYNGTYYDWNDKLYAGKDEFQGAFLADLKSYLGTDDPTEIQAQYSSIDEAVSGEYGSDIYEQYLEKAEKSVTQYAQYIASLENYGN